MKLVEKFKLNFNTIFAKTLAFSYLVFHYWYYMEIPTLRQNAWAEIGFILFFGYVFFVSSVISALISIYYLADEANGKNYFALALSFVPMFCIYSFMYFPYEELAEVIRLWQKTS